MRKTLLNDPYRVINLVFAIIIIALFFYSLIFGPEDRHPIPSGSMLITGEPSVSTGLSRSFSAIARFDFERAATYNPYGIRIFLFFMLQLIMRVAGFLLAANRQRKAIILTDVILSVILFAIFFRPFFTAFFQSMAISTLC